MLQFESSYGEKIERIWSIEYSLIEPNVQSFYFLDFQNPLSHSDTKTLSNGEIPDVAKICHITLNGHDDQFRVGLGRNGIVTKSPAYVTYLM